MRSQNALQAPSYAAFSHRLRLVFQGTWIRHCGWYSGSWVVRLVDRRYTKYDGSLVGERACVDGPVCRLRNDIVDDDRKGLAAWLQSTCVMRSWKPSAAASRLRCCNELRALRSRDDTRPLIRAVLKDVVFPSVPAKPVALFMYMYVFAARLARWTGRIALLLLPRLVRGQRCRAASRPPLQPSERPSDGHTSGPPGRWRCPICLRECMPGRRDTLGRVTRGAFARVREVAFLQPSGPDLVAHRSALSDAKRRCRLPAGRLYRRCA